MPEIPEIETVRRHLEKKVQGKVITKVIVNRIKALNVSGDQFSAAITDQRIETVRRRAKQIILGLSNNHSLVTHFMLEGYMRLFYPTEEVIGTPSVLLELNTGDKLGLFKINLGYIHLVATTNLSEMSELANLGPEPLDELFSLEKFEMLLATRKGMIKPLLMNQEFIAGIGNVYSNEILFCSGLLPMRRVRDISPAEQGKVYNCMKNILAQAIKMGGVYEEKFDSSDNLTGGFEPYLKVAYRTGKPCLLCGKPIISKRVGGRNAFFCPICQQ